MLCDSPSNYMREPESLDFIANIPTVWDKSIAINGEVAKYVTISADKEIRGRGRHDRLVGTRYGDNLSFLPKGTTG